MALYVTAGGALVLPYTSGPVPAKSNVALPSRRSMVTASCACAGAQGPESAKHGARSTAQSFRTEVDEAGTTSSARAAHPDGRAVIHLVLGPHGAHLRQLLLLREAYQHLPHRRLRVGLLGATASVMVLQCVHGSCRSGCLPTIPAHLDVVHVGLHCGQAILRYEVPNQPDALVVGGNLLSI